MLFFAFILWQYCCCDIHAKFVFEFKHQFQVNSAFQLFKRNDVCVNSLHQVQTCPKSTGPVKCLKYPFFRYCLLSEAHHFHMSCHTKFNIKLLTEKKYIIQNYNTDFKRAVKPIVLIKLIECLNKHHSFPQPQCTQGGSQTSHLWQVCPSAYKDADVTLV